MNSDRLRFEAYLLDPGRRELTREGTLIPLQSRVFDLLLYLATHRDRVVGKDELLDAVWPGRVITEAALARAVMKARKAVDDDASQQAIIRTVHGHGYRFVASVMPDPEPTSTSPEGTVADSISAAPDEADTPARQGASIVAAADTAPPTEAPGVPRAQGSRTDAAQDMPAASGNLKRWSLPVVLLVLVAALVMFAGPWRSSTVEAGALRLAVLPVIDDTGDPDLAWSRLGLMSFVSGQLAGATEFQLVRDSDVLKLAEQAGWAGPIDGEAAEGLAGRLATIHGARHVLALALTDDGAGLRLNWTLFTPGERPRRGTMVGSEGTALADGVVQAVYGDLLGRSRLDSEAPLVSPDPFLNEAFARGLALSVEGRCAEAERYFRVVIDAEPAAVAPRFELAACLRILGRNDEAEPLLQSLVGELRAEGDSLALAKSLMTLGVLYNRTGRLDEAEATHARALAVAEAIGANELAGRILQNQAIVAEDRNDWAGSEALLDRAVLAYQLAGRETLPGQIASHRANLAMDQGRLAEADAHLQEAIEAFRAAGDRRNEAMMLNNAGYLRRQQGRLDEAETFHYQSLAIREEIGDRVGIGRIYGMLATVRSSRGDYAGAAEAAEAALEIAIETDDRLFEGTALAHLGDAQRGLGATDDARASYERSRDVLLSIDDRMRALQVDLRLARLAMDAGDPGLAAETATRVLGPAREQSLAQAELDAMELLGDAALAAGDPEQARLEYEATLERVRATDWAARELRISAKLAELLLDVGDLDAAAPLVGVLAAGEPSLSSLRTQARYASLGGDPDAAVRLLEQGQALDTGNWGEDDQASLDAYRAAAR